MGNSKFKVAAVQLITQQGRSVAEAARSLGGMKRTTLIYKIERLGIRPEEYHVRD